MASRQRVPEVRFKGFEGEWEEKELGEVSDSFSGGTPTVGKNEFYGGPIPFIRSAEINRDSTELYISDDGLYGSSAKIVNVGDILYALYGATSGEVGRSKITGAINQAILAILPKINFDAEFILHWLRKEKEHIINTYLQGGQGNLSGAIVKSFKIYFPFNTEQSQIGSFFQNLDALITQRQKKLEKLASIKKAMLEKMFPKDGEDEPELRFKGCTGKWKRRTMGELYRERNERGNSSLPILSVSIHHGVSHGELDSDTLGKQVRRSEDKSLYKHVITGDLVFNMMRAWQGAVGVVQTEGMVSPAYTTAVPGEELFPEFMEFCIRRESIISQMDNLSYGVTDFRKRLYWDSFIRISCSIPSIPEQMKIASYFQHLDSLISLQKRELDKLRNMKKACLSKMFM